MTRRELVGSEGGTEPVIILAFTKPWGFYATVKVTLPGYRIWRARFTAGPMFRLRWPKLDYFAGRTHSACPCGSGRMITPDSDGCGGCRQLPPAVTTPAGPP